MDHLGYLFAGFAVFWAGLFAYILWLQARLRTVARELERLEERLAEFELEETRPNASRPAPRPGGGDAAVRYEDSPPATPPSSTPQRTAE